ncbi:MAG: carbohydrate binding family 9 domain-containing protein, partial [candidate division Zixibacteria bacterium]|nr:carbohydrate binding family 9 domain-containing protein [candidate division Zixibacteria bacterium]
LDDDCWKKAEKSGDFVQAQPHDGEPATESTYVQVCYDNDALYVAVTCMESEPEKIIEILTRRDRFSESDCVNLGIDSYHDHQTGYMFKTYASGTQCDIHYFNDNSEDDSWDAVWESDVKIGKDRWTVEYKIPFSCLRFPKNETPTWGFYVSRFLGHNDETCRWIRIPSDQSGFVSRWGHLTGIKDIDPPMHLEILPYAVSWEKTEPGRLGNLDGREFFGNTGIDLKYGLTSNLTLDATINPDFGQVEIDEIVLNLTNYETFYPEKRPFFLEGNKIFEPNSNDLCQLFYSRRIGKNPEKADSAEYYFHRPTSTTILGAVKITGKTKRGTTIGFLNAVTKREKADFWHSSGFRTKRVVEPEANYNVLRLSQDIFKNSVIGIMSTAVNQRGKIPSYAGGLDWSLRFWKENYNFIGQILGSSNGKKERGAGYLTVLEKIGGEHWRGQIVWFSFDKKINTNRLGYTKRNDIKGGSIWVQYKTQKEFWIIRNSWNNFNLSYDCNLDNVTLDWGFNFNSSIELTNSWVVEGGFYSDLGETNADWEVPSQLLKIPVGRSAWININTDDRKKVCGGINYNLGNYWDGLSSSVYLWLTIKPRSNLEVTLEPDWNHMWDISRFVGYAQDESDSSSLYIFGKQEVNRAGLGLHGTYTFSKNLSIQAYTQFFFAKGEYTDLSRFTPMYQFSPLGDTAGFSLVHGDFHRREFASNLILRWEYRPGSTLYLVWTQGRYNYDRGEFHLRKDFSHLFSTIPYNTFLIKANYWWNL